MVINLVIKIQLSEKETFKIQFHAFLCSALASMQQVLGKFQQLTQSKPLYQLHHHISARVCFPCLIHFILRIIGGFGF